MADTLPPCPVCGERELLNDACSGEVIRLVDGAVRPDPACKYALPIADEVEFIACEACAATMPATVWRGERPTAEYRAAVRAYYLDDEAEAAACA